MKGTDTGTFPPARQESRPRTYFPNAVLAEVFIVAENDNFAGHGCTDAEPALNLKNSWGGGWEKKSITSECTSSMAKAG